MGRGRAIVLLSVLFALAHLSNPDVTAAGIGNIALAGIFLSLAFYSPGGMWTAFGAHLGWNATLAALAAPVSGLPFDIPYIDYRMGSPVWLTGGAFGPEGGLLATVTLAATVVLVAQWISKGTDMKPRRRHRGGHDGQRHRARLRAARLVGGPDRHGARGAGEGHGDDHEQPRPPGEEGHAAGGCAGRGARAHRDRRPRSTPRPAPSLVIEAASENPAVKFAVFEQLDRLAAPDAILATNTSSISITEIAARTRRPGAGDRHALHEPGAGDAAGRGDPRPRHQRRDDPRPSMETAARAGQDAGRGERLSPASSPTAC